MSEFNNSPNLQENQNLGASYTNTENKKGVPFVLAIIFFALGFLVSIATVLIDYTFRKSQAYDIKAMAFGAAFLFGCIILIAVLFLLSTKVFKKKVLLLVFSIIFMLGSFGSTAATGVKYVVIEAKANKAAEQKMISMVEDLQKQKPVVKEEFKKSEYGRYTPLMIFMNDYFMKAQKLSGDMAKDLSALQLETVLHPNTFKSVEGINDAKKRIDASIKAYEKYDASYADLVSSLKTGVNDLKLPQSFKDGFFKGFSGAQEESGNYMKKFYKVEKDISSKVNGLLDYLLTIQGKYQIEDGDIYFASDEAVDKYDAYIMDIESLAKEEADIQKSMQESVKAKIDQMNKKK